MNDTEIGYMVGAMHDRNFNIPVVRAELLKFGSSAN